MDIPNNGFPCCTEHQAIIDRLRAENAELRKPDPCSVCAGTGKPVSGLPCICSGRGSQAAEMEGLRQQVAELEEALAREAAEANNLRELLGLTTDQCRTDGGAAWEEWTFWVGRGSDDGAELKGICVRSTPTSPR